MHDERRASVVVARGARSVEERLLADLDTLAEQGLAEPRRLALPVRIVVPSRSGDEVERARRVEAYAGQGRVYTRSVREAFRLDRTPRFELWFLDDDRVETLRPPLA